MRGHKLLKDKRDELMRQFLDLVRENKALRQKVEAGIRAANTNFVMAKAAMSEADAAHGADVPEAGGQSGCQQPERHERGCARSSATGPARRMRTTSTPTALPLRPSDLDGAVQSLAQILPDMLRLAEVEKSCQLMAEEIEKTRRRVNALEHVIIPETEKNIKFITMKLDENERSTQIRLMKVKDMMLEQAHHYSRKQQGYAVEIETAP